MSFLKDLKSNLDNFADDLKKPLKDIREKVEKEVKHHTHDKEQGQAIHHDNRFHSFAPRREHNSAKWFVDGCGYMWAISIALEEARESIWILDWWLSPGCFSLFAS